MVSALAGKTMKQLQERQLSNIIILIIQVVCFHKHGFWINILAKKETTNK